MPSSDLGVARRFNVHRNILYSFQRCGYAQGINIVPFPNCKLYCPQHPGIETNQCLYRPCEDGIRPPAKRPLLLPRHRKARLTWCRRRIQDWTNILFTDESQLHLNSNDSRDRVHRPVGERYTDTCVVHCLTFGCGRVMSWCWWY